MNLLKQIPMLFRNILTFWPNFFREAVLLYRYSKAVKSIQPELEEQGLRIDLLGRVYTVVTIAEEFRQQPEMMQQSMVFKDLKPVNDILMKYGLSEYAYPLIEKIEGSHSFLVVLYPETDYFNGWRTMWNSVLLASIIKLVFLTISWTPSVIEWFKNI